MTTTTQFTKAPTATDLLWAVFHPSQEQRRRLAALPTTASGVLVAVASAAVLGDEGTVQVLNPRSSVLVYSHYVAHGLGLAESTVKGHLRSLEKAGLVTGRAVGNGFTAYAANGHVILATLADRRVIGQSMTKVQ